MVVTSDSERTALYTRSRFMTICYKKSAIILFHRILILEKNSMNSKIKDLQ
jgi:hypothetical protein